MQAKVERIHIDDNKRIIVISDIHGDIDSLKELLMEIKFQSDDVLILNGDMVEKGPKSLETLHYIMELSNSHTVYSVCGNCDAIARAVYHEDRNKELLMYLLIRKDTLLNEMCHELSISLDENSDMLQIKEKLKEHFTKELEWINQLPDIIETKNFIFAHAGTRPNNLEQQKHNYVRSTKAFMEQGLSFSKYCIVGHWPVSLYNTKKPCGNPIIDEERKIISIDGGNVLKLDGQLNALIIPHKNANEFSFHSYDKLKTGIAKDSQEESTDSCHILWTDNLIRVMEKEEEFSYCEQISTKKRMWILNKYIYEDMYGCHCEGSTDYKLPIKAGDVVKVVEITNKGYLIKKDGITGWYYGSLLM
ncbi:MAG: metallophosphoesterase [Anaerocolumna sp.]|jgi:protein phosphatase|nr:metallophosphoesterase [Anaerocolumna sp.]